MAHFHRVSGGHCDAFVWRVVTSKERRKNDCVFFSRTRIQTVVGGRAGSAPQAAAVELYTIRIEMGRLLIESGPFLLWAAIAWERPFNRLWK